MKLLCTICDGENTTEVIPYKERLEEKINLCYDCAESLRNDTLEYNERIIMNEFIEANYGEIV